MSLRKFLCLFFLLPLLLLTGLGGFRVYQNPRIFRVDSSANRLMDADPRTKETVSKVTNLRPGSQWVVVALELNGLFSNRGAEVIREASDRILSVEGAVEVKSLTHSGRPVANGFLNLEVEVFLPRSATREEWEALEAFTTRFPLSRNILVSEDGRYAVLVGIFERDLPGHQAKEAFRQEFMTALEGLETETESIHVLSFPFMEAEGVTAIKKDLIRYAAAAGILIFLILFVTFRSWAVVFTVLLFEIIGAGLLMGTFRLLDRPVDLFNGILFPLVCGLQLTFMIHYLAALQHAGRHHRAFPAARAAFREVFPPSCIAALTTIAGLLTLAIADVETLRDFGRIGAVSVGAVFLFTFLLPALLAFGKPPSSKITSRSVKTARPLPVRGAYAFGILAVSFCLVMGFGIFQIRKDIRVVEYIEPGHPVRESLEVLNRDLGGMNIFPLWIETDEAYGLQTLPVLNYMEDLRRFAYQLEGVTDAYAYSQLYIALDQIFQNRTMPSDDLPQDPAKIDIYSRALNATELMFGDSFVKGKARSSMLILRTRDMPGRAYLDLLKTFMEKAEESAPEGVTLNAEEGLHNLLKADREIVSSQLKTLSVTLGLIAVLLSLLWRSTRLAGILLLANVPALLTIFGIMGYTGFPMNAITVMVAAVILGIAVDDGIHLVSSFRKYRRQGIPPEDAASQALRRKWKPIACTSSILAVFLGLLLLTSFPPVAHFGILSAFGLLVALLGAIILLPGFLAHLSEPDTPNASL